MEHTALLDVYAGICTPPRKTRRQPRGVLLLLYYRLHHRSFIRNRSERSLAREAFLLVCVVTHCSALPPDARPPRHLHQPFAGRLASIRSSFREASATFRRRPAGGVVVLSACPDCLSLAALLSTLLDIVLLSYHTDCLGMIADVVTRPQISVRGSRLFLPNLFEAVS